MFDMFWALADKKDQSTFVAITVGKSAIKRATHDKQIIRDFSFKY